MEEQKYKIKRSDGRIDLVSKKRLNELNEAKRQRRQTSRLKHQRNIALALLVLTWVAIGYFANTGFIRTPAQHPTKPGIAPSAVQTPTAPSAENTAFIDTQIIETYSETETGNTDMRTAADRTTPAHLSDTNRSNEHLTIPHRQIQQIK